MWKVHGLPWHERFIYHTWTNFLVFPFCQLLQLWKCLGGYMCGDNLTMKCPRDFHNYTGLNVLANSSPWFTIAPPYELILGWKPHWSAKRKKNKIMWEMVARRWESSLKKLQALRTPTLLKRNSNTDFSSKIFKIFKNTLIHRSPAAVSAGLRFPACNFVKKETAAKMFFCEFYRVFRNIFWQDTSGWLILVFIWQLWEVFQNTAFIENLILSTSQLFHTCFLNFTFIFSECITIASSKEGSKCASAISFSGK